MLSTLRRFVLFAVAGVGTVTVAPWLATGDWVGGATGFILGVLACLLLAWQLTPYLESRKSRQ